MPKKALADLEAAMAQFQQLEENRAHGTAWLQEEHAKLNAERELVKKAREALEAEKAAMMKCGVGPHDLIGLNFRGEKTVTMKRSVLCQVEGSTLAAMFSGRYEDNLEYDKDGNVFVGHPPSVVMPLMDCLTVRHDWPLKIEFPDIDIPKRQKRMWDGAVKLFGLESVAQPLPMVFRGIKTNLKINELKGWAIAFYKSCSELTTLADFNLPRVAGDSAVLFGVKEPDTDELLVAAVSRLDIIKEKMHCFNHRHNDVYWTLTPGIFVFSKTPLDQDTLNLNHNYVTTRNTAGEIYCKWSLRCTHHLEVAFEKIIMVPKQRIRI